MKVKVNNTPVEITRAEVQRLVNGAVRTHNGHKDASYDCLDVLDLLLARMRADRQFQNEYNNTGQGD